MDFYVWVELLGVWLKLYQINIGFEGIKQEWKFYGVLQKSALESWS